MGIGQGGVFGVSGAKGGVRACPWPARPGLRQARSWRGQQARSGAQRKAPLAPRPLACASGALAKIFFTFSTTIFFKENVNGY